MSKAFEGVRVIDFTQVLAGPFCTEQLALLGADVVKIELREGGDQGRGLMRHENAMGDVGLSSLFVSVNASKRSLTLDLKHPRAKEILARLVRDADVVVQNFRAGAIDRLGFGYDWARSIRPDIVYCSISGYGQEGPFAGAAAYDGAVQASSGMMSMTGHPETGPTRAGFTVVDLSTAITAAYAISAALFRRAMTGEGQHLDVSMFDSALTLLGPMLSDYANANQVPELLGNGSPARIPTSDVFETADDPIMVTCLTERQWQALAEVLDLAELTRDPRFVTNADRRENTAALRPLLDAAYARRSATEWERLLGEAGIPSARVLSVPQVMEHPQLRHRDVVMRMGGVPGLPDEITGIGSGWKADVDGPRPSRPPPLQGQHTDEILTEIGYGADEIAELRESQVI